jgi:prepilin-type N-terminal cleavage/methylation domain-containing protein/prepilin-type processing-associated H-X9-DG protein
MTWLLVRLTIKSAFVSMRLHLKNRRRTGLTFVELLVVLAVISVLFALLYPTSRGCKEKGPVTACVNNLKQVALSEIVWANDHEPTNVFFAQRSTNAGGFRELLLPGSLPHFYRALSNELVNPRILTCPSDSRKPTEDFASLTTNHLSYFVNMDVRSEAEITTALHGDRHITFNPAARGQVVTLTTNLSLGWTRRVGHGNIGNIAFADGSVAKSTDRDLIESLMVPSRVSVQRVLFP